MPAIKLFGRKWLAATDDLVYPGLFEIFFRTVWLMLIGGACYKYYEYTWSCRLGGELVRVYLLGEAVFLLISIIFMLVIVRHSAKGAIMDTRARKYVEPLVTAKILLLLPEIAWNALGSLWMFGSEIECSYEHYTVSVVKTLVVFDWVLIGLMIVGLVVIFDPMGSLEKKQYDSFTLHDKLANNWRRRFRCFCWMKKDENANLAFDHFAAGLTCLFRGTDLVPSDCLAGIILLRIRQKYETHELRRLNMLPAPVYTSDVSAIFHDAPSWMSLDDALHYMKICLAVYGWIFVMYKHCYTGCFRVIANLTCCGCFRKHTAINGDNCCYCYLGGFKDLSGISADDILFASFRDRICEIPYCVYVDHKMKKIVIVIRGSLSIRDIFTDFAADSDVFEWEGVPPGSQGHTCMIAAAKFILNQLDENKVLERAFITYSEFNLMITGHSLGAGIGILLAFYLRPRYPNVKVYAFSTPAGLLSRQAAKASEEFALTIGVGDDLVMRLSMNSIEDLRVSLIMCLQSCRLPKYRVILNGLSYMLLGQIPEKDLNRAWTDSGVINTSAGQSPLLNIKYVPKTEEQQIYEDDITKRRLSKAKLYVAGRILHIISCKAEQKDKRGKKKKAKKQKYEMRWCQPEEFSELLVTPRMGLDHLPKYVQCVLKATAKQQSSQTVHL
ncbi:diacylglycerol lipase-beta isoform X1 [Megachile rotundata]|uniref:diacylglycerol lipase-beta isoform X1 n=2 Tax=Megachile rotundata TaxID=143995 RepID=UPI000258DCA2|nr:PREDICTED: sn1-specific diacylglycerol lipase beta-like isoform X1 [Megachile rotundata]